MMMTIKIWLIVNYKNKNKVNYSNHKNKINHRYNKNKINNKN